MKIIVGTRGSKLALAQANCVIRQLESHHPEIQFEIKVIKTTGDLIQNVSLDKIGDKGLFVKEIEQKLIEKKIDIAIHSMKDMPSTLPPQLKFAAIPKREDARDVLILREGYQQLDELPQGAIIGTGSKRRKYQILDIRPDLSIVPIRGNIETRIQKIETENLDGIILAAAGLIRADLEHKISTYLSISDMLPAPAQGVLGIEIRKQDGFLENIIQSVEDETTTIQTIAERSFLEGINGSCHIPIGGYCHQIEENKILLTGLYGDGSGNVLIKKSITGDVSEAREIGFKLAKKILKEYEQHAR